MTETIHVTCLGAKARELLARLDFSGQVIAVVSDAVYLQLRSPEQSKTAPQSPPLFQTGQGQVVWLTQNQVKHQRAILCACESSALRVGMRLTHQDKFLRFENGVLLNWTDASEWQPSIITGDQATTREIVSMRVRGLFNALQALGSLGGFAQFLPLIFLDAPSSPTSSPFVNAAMNPIAAIARACRNGDLTRAIESSRALIGLGQGLTPSGDDFIGGMLFAVRYLKDSFPGSIDWNQATIDDLLASARDETNAISYTILCDHAAGQSIDALHDLLNTLLIEKKSDELVALAQRVVNLGNTSGWDMLAGALTGMLSIDSFDRRRPMA